MKILLVHDEMLNPEHPLFEAYPDHEPIFVLDDEILKEEDWSLKRIQFVGDALSEMPHLRVFKGKTAEVLKSLGATVVISQATPSQALKRALQGYPVQWAPEPEFLSYSGPLKRFMQFWRAVEPQVIEKSAREANQTGARRPHRP